MPKLNSLRDVFLFLNFELFLMISPQRLHKSIGLTLLLPLLGWIVTAFVFYFKPGYDKAYASLSVKTYSLENVTILPANPAWQEIRYFRTILGPHLCVRTAEGWTQLDPITLKNRPAASEEDLHTLLVDAFSSDPERYGSILSMSSDGITTTTGVRITLDWERMSLYQRGADTDLIDLLYRVHYLQWTGIPAIDNVLGPTGLVLILFLSILGIKLAVNRRDKRHGDIDSKKDP